MCTAIHISAPVHYFGRNLDLECSYGERPLLMPRNYPLQTKTMGTVSSHYAALGMGIPAGGFPLFYDGFNEKGLCIAGLNYPHSVCYETEGEGPAAHELIPWLLAACASVCQVREAMAGKRILSIPLAPGIPSAPMHWIVSDSRECLVIEQDSSGLHLYDNPAGVLSNEPSLPYHLQNLNNYRGLSVDTPPNTFGLPLEIYCQGLGGVGLPGDVSSMSRFVRAAFHAKNALWEGGEAAQVNQFLHLLTSVEMVKGLCRLEGDRWDYTVYSSCMVPGSGKYYYCTYDDRSLRCAQLKDLDGREAVWC